MKLSWRATGIGSQGLDRGVLYLGSGAGIPWNGLTGVTETGDTEIQSDLYYDGVRFAFAQSSEDFGLSLEAWTYPPEFEVYDGVASHIYTKQNRGRFGFSYRVDLGVGYEIHLVWNAAAEPADKPYSSRNDELEVSLFQWQLSTKPERISGIKPTAHFVVDTNFAPAVAVTELEAILYGTSTADSRMPSPQEVIDLFLGHAVLVVTDNGNGTATITGPDSAFETLDANRVRLTWPSVIYKDANTVQISSM